MFGRAGYNVFIRRLSTIFALSSGQGKSGVAVIRVSGPRAADTVLSLTSPNRRSMPQPRLATLRTIRDPNSGEPLDRGLLLWFPGPNSFTGEDCCEFQVHGGLAVVASVLRALGRIEGCRLAEPGEFTKRAFYAGKLDLTAVEGLADLINAETEMQRKQAFLQMDGSLYNLYSKWREALLKCLANIEASIDFAEDQQLESDLMRRVKTDLTEILTSMEKHLVDGRKGQRLRSGVNMAIIGAPNVGKSSLLNTLSQQPTAIVSDIPGTTRDIVSAHLNIAGYPVNVMDTAGLRTTPADAVEVEGMSRAKRVAQTADLIVLVADAFRLYEENRTFPDDIRQYLTELNLNLEDLHGIQILVVLNKIDKITGLETRKIPGKIEGLHAVSCKTEQGMQEFLTTMSEHFKNLCGNPSSADPVYTQARHKFCIEECVAALKEFYRFSDDEEDLAAEQVRLALTALGKITGHVNVEEVLNVIFRDFCIGK